MAASATLDRGPDNPDYKTPDACHNPTDLDPMHHAMRSRFLRMTGSLLGLIAILMCSVAPVVSQTLAAEQGVHENGMHCDMPSMQHERSHGSMHDSMHGSSDACGYCGFFAHLPLLASPSLVLAHALSPSSQTSATSFESVRLLPPVRPGQPRAPPRPVA